MRRRELDGRARAGDIAAANARQSAAEAPLRSDAELMREVARGDRAAFGELYDRLGGSVLSLASRMLGSRLEAEDVVHDVFLECWRDAAHYDPKLASVRTWFLVRTRSRALDRMRGERRRATLRLDEAMFVHLQPRPSEAAVSGEHGRLRRLLRELSSDQRKVVELGYFAGYSSSEIARFLGIPIGTVKSRTLRALERLRVLLQQCECTRD